MTGEVASATALWSAAVMLTSRAGGPSGALWIAALTVVALLPFLGKPFHVDDPLFLWSAAQIVREPLDFYGAPVNWYGMEQPLHAITKNPPLVSYAIAAVSRWVGFSELGLHAAFLVPAAAATLGTGFLAARLGAPPTLAALSLLFSPAFLTSASSVMCDVPLLACFVWAIFFWIRGLEDRRTGSLFAAGLLVAAAALTKYFGMALLPLLALYALWRERRLGVWCVALLVPLLVLAAYQWGTFELYGRGLLSDAAAYATTNRTDPGEGLLRETLLGLSFTGACAAPLLFFLPALVSWRWLAAGACAAGALGLALPTERSGLTAQIALHAVVGAFALGLPLADVARRRSADAILLLAWVTGTFVFAVFVNWTLNARSILPLLPALGIGIARRLAGRGAGRLWQLAPLVPAAALAFVVASEDQRIAENAKRAAASFHAKYGERPDRLWFQGHWGFQYYMQEHGFHPLDQERSRLPAGSLVARQLNNSGVFPLPWAQVRRVEHFDESPGFAAVMDRQAGAGFYTSLWGPLPFAFGGARADRFAVFEVTHPIAFELGREEPRE